MPKFGDHFYAPVTVGDSRPVAFVVDTGASTLTVNDALLDKSKAVYKVVNPSLPIRLADGRRIMARSVRISALKVGPFELKDVQAVSCRDCLPLLGQSVLSKFDLKTAKVQGVEFVAFSPRN